MLVLELSIVNVALPRIGRDLKLSTTGLQWVVTARALTFGGFLPVAARGGDLYGRRPLVVGGSGLFTVSSLAAELATDG